MSIVSNLISDLFETAPAVGAAEVPFVDKLFPFQIEGAQRVAAQGRVLLADEMGLGKTRQAIAGAAARGRFPVLVVCPSTLKGNWRDEILAVTGCDPSKVVVLGGKTPVDTAYAGAEWIIINWDVVSHWAADLAVDVEGLILDESHYAKNDKAARTKAVATIAEALPEEAAVVLLSGTPLKNRPVELISQLRILGALDKVAPRPRRFRNADPLVDFEWAFKFRFCGPQNSGHGWSFTGFSEAANLRARLLDTVMVRRTKDEVLKDLPPKQRRVVNFSLNGALNDYRSAVKALMAEIAGRDLKGAEALTLLGGLRRLAGVAKIDATVEWVENFLAETDDRKLVIFAAHKDVQRGLLDAFPGACHILAGQSSDEIDANKARFNDAAAQADADRIIVCSLKAASTGHTLLGGGTCSDVVITELDWTPGDLLQAEDRIHRIGQGETATMWYLLAEECETDAVLWSRVMEGKAQSISQVLDGREFDEGEQVSAQEAALEIIERMKANA